MFKKGTKVVVLITLTSFLFGTPTHNLQKDFLLFFAKYLLPRFGINIRYMIFFSRRTPEIVNDTAYTEV